MTKVLVHGNPETAAIWGPLIESLAERAIDDVVAVSPPGFGSECTADWPATPAAYVDWLHAEVAAMDGPVDIVGHDWGAGHVLGLAATHPNAIRSWAADCAGLVHSDYAWHDAAAAWQTPELGEASIEMMLSLSNEERTAGYEGIGMAPAIAAATAGAFTPDMGRCILALYRAAAQPYMADLGNRLAAADQRPSLLFDATADPFVPSEMTREVAQRIGSDLHTLDGHGHWWMMSAPADAADALVDFWHRVESTDAEAAEA